MLSKSNVMLVIVCLSVCFVGFFAWTRRDRLPTMPTQKLVVGMMNGWPPFMSINQAGEMEGYDVAVAGLIAQRLGMDLEIIDLGSPQTILIALEQDAVDLAMSGFDNTKKRMEVYNMVRYTSRESTSAVLLFWNHVPQGISCIEDLAAAGMTVAIEPGSALDRYADTIPGLLRLGVPAIQDLIMEVRFGKVAAALVEPRVAKRLSKQIPELVSIEQKLPAEFAVYGEGIAIKKENIALAADVARIVAQLQKEGLLKQHEDTWQVDGGV